MQDHYVEVHTTKGRELILMRFRDALQEAGHWDACRCTAPTGRTDSGDRLGPTRQPDLFEIVHRRDRPRQPIVPARPAKRAAGYQTADSNPRSSTGHIPVPPHAGPTVLRIRFASAATSGVLHTEIRRAGFKPTSGIPVLSRCAPHRCSRPASRAHHPHHRDSPPARPQKTSPRGG